MMRKKLLLIPVALFFFNGVNAQNPSGFSSEKLLEFNTYIQNEIDAENIAGAEILIAQNDVVAWQESFGKRNMKTSAPLTKNSIYYIQSMTKPLISVAIMQLVEKGMIGLEDPVNMYIPEVKNLEITTDVELGIDAPTRAPKKTMTIRNLLTHTAGMTHGLGSSKLDQELFKLMYNETLDIKGIPI